MDDFDESDLEEALNEVGEGTDDTSYGGGGFNGFNPFSRDDKEEDVKSINDRTGKNEEIRKTDEDYGKTSSNERKKKEDAEDADDITGSSKGKGSDELDSTKSREDKEGSKDSGNYSDSDQSEKKEKEDKKEEKNKDEDKNSETKDDNKDDSGGGFIKRKFARLWKKIKVVAIIAAIVIGAFVLGFLVVAIYTAIDQLTLGLVSSYGVPETKTTDTGSMPGLYSDTQFQYDSNGNLAYTYSNKYDENIVCNKISAQYTFNPLSFNEPQAWRLIPNGDGSYSIKTISHPYNPGIFPFLCNKTYDDI